MYRTTTVPTSGKNGVRAPRGIAVVAGKQVRFEQFNVEQNAFSAANTFELTLPFFVRDKSDDPVLAIDPQTASLLVNQDLVPVQLYVGYPSDPNNYQTSDLTQVMEGTMDTARWEFSKRRGETVTLNGRNKVGDLIDTKVIDKYANQTASSIAEKFAAEHGLTPQVTPTTQFAGTYYNQQASLISNRMTQWDLLLFLAKREHFICRVKDNILYFGPYDTVVAQDTAGTGGAAGNVLGGAAGAGLSATGPMLLTYGYNIDNLDLERSPHAARDIQVTVLSYNRDGKQRIKATASSNTQQASKIAGQLGKRGKYNLVFTIPGLTQAQAENRARQILGRYSGTQIIGNLTTAGDETASIDRKLTLAGVGAGLSQDYHISKVVHHMSVREGYVVELGFSSKTDYTTDDLSDSMPGDTSGNAISNSGSANAILNDANAIGGKQFWPNACAFATNQVLVAAGIDVRDMGVANVNYAPDYQNIGQTITDPAQFQPGDLVLSNWGPDPSRGGAYDYGHIGIYAGNGLYWNVSTSAGYKWVLTPLPGGQIQAQRL